MQPAKGSKEEAVLNQLRKATTSFGTDWLVNSCGLKSVQELQRIISRLRRMGFGINSWKEHGEVYAYQLKDEAKAEDPFIYLSRLVGKRRSLEIPCGEYIIEISKEKRDNKNLVDVLFLKRSRKRVLVQYYLLDERGLLSVRGDDEVPNIIPVEVVKYSYTSAALILPEDRMLVDHIRAHIVQNFVRQALEDKGKRKKPVRKTP